MSSPAGERPERTKQLVRVESLDFAIRRKGTVPGKSPSRTPRTDDAASTTTPRLADVRIRSGSFDSDLSGDKGTSSPKSPSRHPSDRTDRNSSSGPTPRPVDALHKLKDHTVIVVCGVLMDNLVHVIAPLRSKALKRHDPIVILYEQNPSKEEWHSILKSLKGYHQVMFVLGSSLLHLQRASIRSAKRVLVLNAPSDKHQTDDAVDTNVIIATRSVEHRYTNVQLAVTEVSQGTSIRFLGHPADSSSFFASSRSAGRAFPAVGIGMSTVRLSRRLSMDPPHLSPRAGNNIDAEQSIKDHGALNDVASPRSPRNRGAAEMPPAESLVEGRLAEAENRLQVRDRRRWFDLAGQNEEIVSAAVPEYHFRPRFAAGFVVTTSVFDSLVCQAFLNPSVLSLLKLMVNKDYGGPRIFQLAVPPELTSRTYGEILEYLLRKHDTLAVGLYRAGGYLGSFLPYVYTNPPADSKVYQSDRLFVLTTTPEDLGELR